MSSELEQIKERLAALETGLGQSAARIAMLEQGMIDLLQKTVRSAAMLEQRYGADHVARSLAHVAEMFRKERTVIFVGRSYFGGNIKYGFLAFCQFAKQTGIECRFMAGDKRQYEQLTSAGLPCLPYDAAAWSAEDIRLLLRASVAVLGDYFVPHGWHSPLPYALLQGARLVQLWHGIPIKRIGLENIPDGENTSPGAAEFLAASGPFDVLVGSSAAARADWARRFAFRDYAPAGYPCTDIFFRDLTPQDKINIDAEALADIEVKKTQGARIIFYTPTFRHHADASWFEKTDIAALASHGKPRGHALYVNLHPAEHGLIEGLRARYPDIRFLAPNTDVYPLLKQADLMITDYSSLAFEFLLLDRPIIFHRPDHADYIARSNALIEGHEDYVAGAVTADGDQLIEAVDAALGGGDKFHDARAALRRKFFDRRDGLAAQRLNEYILGLLPPVAALK